MFRHCKYILKLIKNKLRQTNNNFLLHSFIPHASLRVIDDLMAKTGNTNTFIAIKSMFEQGNVAKMKDIEKLFPTAMAIALGMNHNRYVLCLYDPEKFLAKDLILFARLVDIDSRLIWEVIAKETRNKKIVRRKPSVKVVSGKKAT